MTEDQNSFDKILQDKFDSQHFPFDEENWERAEHALEAKRKKEKQRKIAVIFFAGLFTGIALMLPFIKYDSGKHEATSLIQKNDKQLSSSAGVVTAPSGFKNKKEKKNNSLEHISPTETEVSNTSPIKNHRHNIDSAHEYKFQNGIVNEKAYAETKSAHAPEVTPSSAITTIQPDINKSPVAESAETSSANNDSLTKADSNSETNQTADSASRISAASAEGMHDKPPGFSNAFTFNLTAGADYLTGWKNNSTKEGRGFNPVIGFGVNRSVSAMWELSSGVRYGSVANLNSSKKTFTTYVSDFGENRIDTTIYVKWIHYLVVPVFLQYHFNDKNLVAIGGSVSYCITTSNEVAASHYVDFNQPVESKKASSGYTKGINPVDATAIIAYRRKINNSISIAAEAHYGLLDIKDDTFFSSQTIERNTGIRLLLQYHIF